MYRYGKNSMKHSVQFDVRDLYKKNSKLQKSKVFLIRKQQAEIILTSLNLSHIYSMLSTNTECFVSSWKQSVFITITIRLWTLSTVKNMYNLNRFVDFDGRQVQLTVVLFINVFRSLSVGPSQHFNRVRACFVFFQSKGSFTTFYGTFDFVIWTALG